MSNLNDLMIQKITVPLYKGHNNHQNNRILGFLPYMLLGYEVIKMNTFLLVRYKYPGSGLSRLVPFKEISNSIRFPFIISFPVYIMFDVIHRNRKYNKNKSFKEKALYTTDLLLFHSFATFLFPLYLSGFMANFFPKAFGFFVRSKFPLMFLSVAAFLGAGSIAVKASDIFTDIILDNTFRKFVYNFKEDSNLIQTIQPNEIKQPIDVAAVVENLVKI